MERFENSQKCITPLARALATLWDFIREEKLTLVDLQYPTKSLGTLLRK